MKYWLTTDTHFGHRKLEEYSGRPTDFEERIFNGLRRLTTTDILIHLGDVCMGKDSLWHTEIMKLDCRKVLVKGNHDGKSDNWYLEHGWDFVCENFTLDIGGRVILFSHEPYPKDNLHTMNIHGHWHNNDHRKDESYAFYDGTYHKLLAIEYTKYQPVELISFIKKQP